MFDLRNITEEQEKDIRRLLKPIGYTEGDEVHFCSVRDGKVIEEPESLVEK